MTSTHPNRSDPRRQEIGEKIRSVYFTARERLRQNPSVIASLYWIQSLRFSNFGEFRKLIVKAKNHPNTGKGVALCCRIRDEARYLEEFVEYYLAAGVNHFFFYEKLSTDNYREVLNPYINRGLVTLKDDWPHVPVSPAAEQDCILSSLNRFEWLGFIDADEFVVIEDGSSIKDFLSDYKSHPGLALHWRMFGSNGHIARPGGPVIAEYTQREKSPNRHLKCFVQPRLVANTRNSHSLYYLGMRPAVNEMGVPVRGSFSLPPTAEKAWINHYHHKSEQDYREKAARKSVLDTVGIRYPSRNPKRSLELEETGNAEFDDCALRYYLIRCKFLSESPKLKLSAPANHEGRCQTRI